MQSVPFKRFDLVVVLVLMIITTFASSFSLRYFLYGVIPHTWLVFISYGMQVFILFMLLWYLNTKYSWSSFKDIGFNGVPFWKTSGLIILSYASYFVIMGVILVNSAYHRVSLPGIGEQEMHIPMFGQHMAGVIVLGIVAIIIAPITEELLFRGYVHSTLRSYYGPMITILLTSVVFALTHFEFEVMIPLFILGFILSTLREHTGSIYPGIAFHMLNNSVTLIAEIAIVFS